MGQWASKTARVARQQAKKGDPTHSQPLAKNDPHTGFTRGQGAQTHHDQQQKEYFLNTTKYKEMPDELIQFIQDVGPLQKKETTTRSKNKSEIKEGRLPELQSDRKQEKMPLSRGVQGFETTRTTSFSNKQESEDPNDLHSDVLTFHDLLVLKRKLGVEQAVDQYYQPHTDWSDTVRQQHKQALKNTAKYLELPVIMLDDEEFIGAWPERVEELKMIKLQEIDDSQVKLVLQDLSDTKKTTAV